MKIASLLSRLVPMLICAATLAACGALPGANPTPLPTIALDQGGAATPGSLQPGEGVIASGVVVPAEEAQLAFGLGGRVEALDVAVGDAVAAGQALGRLEGQENLEAAVSRAQFELGPNRP